jgi:hypothetical protein
MQICWVRMRFMYMHVCILHRPEAKHADMLGSNAIYVHLKVDALQHLLLLVSICVCMYVCMDLRTCLRLHVHVHTYSYACVYYT